MASMGQGIFQRIKHAIYMYVEIHVCTNTCININTCMHKNIHSHFLLLHMGNNLFNCAWDDFLINTCSHEVLYLDFNDSLAPLLISLHNRMNMRIGILN